MLIWLRWRRERAERADAEAEALIRELGVEAYAEARRREYESSDDAMAREWNRIALAVAGKIGKHIGLDTSSRMAMNAVFAPDRGVRPITDPDQVGEMERTLAAKPQPFRVQFIGAASDYGPSNFEGSRDSGGGCVGRNHCRREDRVAPPNDRSAHPRS